MPVKKAAHRYALSVKIYFYDDQCSEENIMEEIESWPDIEEVVVLGKAQADRDINEDDWED